MIKLCVCFSVLYDKHHSGFGKDPRHTKFRLDVFVPVEQLLGQYSVAGQMLVVPLSGHGSSNITFGSLPAER